MWQRSDLKTRAKVDLGRCYWKAVLAALVLGIAAGGGSAGNQANYRLESRDFYGYGYWNISPAVIFGILSSMLLLFAVTIVISIFLLQPLEIGCKRFFLLSRVQETGLGEMGYGFSHGYLNVVKIQFLRGLFTFLWSLLFVIPGIIKSYEYRMIPYLLAENPELDSNEAFRISRELMEGEKWNAFVLDLSFLGWLILSGITCGILAIFYVSPYIAYTNAELYIALQYHRYERYNSQGGYSGPTNPYGANSPYINN